MNRREFLHPRRLANVAGPMLGITDELEAPPSTDDPVLLRFSRQAMATTFEVILPFEKPGENSAWALSVLDEVDRLETQLTVYRETSEVAQINARAAQHPVHVEKRLFDLLLLAQRLHRDTNGALDIACGALIRTWGFFRRQGRIPTRQEREAARERMGMNHVLLDANRQTVYFSRPGLEINLGAIGKGFALDCAARLARGADVFLHAGHSSILALGNERPPSPGWTVGLTDPKRPQCRRALVHLFNRAMATSAITHQYFEFQGRRLGHLLDPRTAWPADGMLSATVTAPTAAEADALATAFFVLGIEKAQDYCEKHPEIGAAMITTEAPARIVLLGKAINEVEIF